MLSKKTLISFLGFEELYADPLPYGFATLYGNCMLTLDEWYALSEIYSRIPDKDTEQWVFEKLKC